MAKNRGNRQHKTDEFKGIPDGTKPNSSRYKNHVFDKETLAIHKFVKGDIKKWEKRFEQDHLKVKGEITERGYQTYKTNKGKKGNAYLLGVNKVRDNFQAIYNALSQGRMSSSQAISAVRKLYTMSETSIRKLGKTLTFSTDIISRVIFFARMGAYGRNDDILRKLEYIESTWGDLPPNVQEQIYNMLLSYADKTEDEMRELVDVIISIMDSVLDYEY